MKFIFQENLFKDFIDVFLHIMFLMKSGNPWKTLKMVRNFDINLNKKFNNLLIILNS